MNSLVIFKNNLRINDNQILYNASKKSKVINTYIYDNVNIKKDLGAASKYWLYHALKNLNKELNNSILFYKGDTIKIIVKLLNTYSIDQIYLEEPFLEEDINLYINLEKKLKGHRVKLITYNSSLLWNPKTILKNDQTPYKVFTPFYKRGCLTKDDPETPLGKPQNISYAKINNGTSINDLKLLSKHRWSEKFNNLWDISEKHALDKFTLFINKSINNYKKGRDFPASNFNSKLSPYIRFGMISIHRIWHELKKLNTNEDIEHFKSEIGWREFSYYLLYHFPYMQYKNFQSKFDNFNWSNSKEKFESWKKGQTGFPFIDAGMQELWQTGYMHNRVRMVVASFLVKNLLIDWKWGEKWFWDCLVDADYASNIAGWQWAAGTGADAAPYFRIFNPMLQGDKFDPDAIYTKKYIPQLNDISPKLIQRPWESPLICNYRTPIIDYKKSRELAMEAYNKIK